MCFIEGVLIIAFNEFHFGRGFSYVPTDASDTSLKIRLPLCIKRDITFFHSQKLP